MASVIGRMVVRLVGFLLFLTAMLSGIFAAAGVCAFIWGPEIIETALGNPPVRNHPAFIAFIVLMVALMLAAGVSSIPVFVIPLYVRFGVKPRGWSVWDDRVLGWYVAKLNQARERWRRRQQGGMGTDTGGNALRR